MKIVLLLALIVAIGYTAHRLVKHLEKDVPQDETSKSDS